MKRNRTLIIAFLTPAILSFIIIFLYPILRTLLMSFYSVKGVADSFSKWAYVGADNYKNLMHSQLFLQSLVNILKIWIFGGIGTMSFALLYAVILTSGIRFRSFWRSLIYLPNIISAVAIATMWTQYVYNNEFGFFKTMFNVIGLHSLAEIKWTSPEFIFSAMLIAYCFGSIGYYMLIFLAGIERIPTEFYEAALLEGAGPIIRFRKITMPLIRDVFRTCIIFWSIGTLSFFVWSQIFTPLYADPATVTPVVYLYNVVFGSSMNIDTNFINVGSGAAVGVVLSLMLIVIYGIVNFAIREEKLEY